jgi:hypothetical protein
MKIFIGLLLLLNISLASAQELVPSEDQIQNWVLDSITEMPSAGGYVLSVQPVKKLTEAFSWSGDSLSVDPTTAVPSYCTTATYQVFYKVMAKYWNWSGSTPDRGVLELIKPDMEVDGLRIWGRWNSNGPGTSKFFHDTQIGKNFSDIRDARPGDFLKIFWNSFIGKREKGHSVIFLGLETHKGVEMIKFWGSSQSTSGYGIKMVPRSDAIRMIFSRIENPENLSNITAIPQLDSFLSSMLTKDSSWDEVRSVTGF